MTYGLTGATVRFGHVTALDDVTLPVPAGLVTAVVGGDGAGKSTLLRAMVGEVVLDSGTVDAPPAQEIGYLPASAGSWLDLTVQQNVDFVGGTYGLRGDALRSRADPLLQRAGLADVRDRLSSQLSGGMRRKLGFVLAMLPDPRLLVLDEPSTGVDPVSRVDLWRLVSEAAAHGAAVLMSTTYLDEAERCASILVLNGGHTLLEGSPATVRAAVDGTIVATREPVRPEYAWRRGRVFHEWWPASGGTAEQQGSAVVPDLEDVVIASSLRRHSRVAAPGSPEATP